MSLAGLLLGEFRHNWAYRINILLQLFSRNYGGKQASDASSGRSPPYPTIYSAADVSTHMDRQQILALVLTLLMVGSSVAYAAVAIF